MRETKQIKPVRWVASSKRDFDAMPKEVTRELGFALYVVQCGGKHPDAKPLSGFGGADAVEVLSDHRGDAFRCIYTVRFADAVYVLHAFQKKSKRGIATPKVEMDTSSRQGLSASSRRSEIQRGEIGRHHD